MTRLDDPSDTETMLQEADGAFGPADGWFDVAVLVENELTGTSARRMTELYQMKNTPCRYHLVRPLGEASARTDGTRQEAERLMQKSIERMEALQASVSGVVADQEPVDALLDAITTTRSQEVVVVTRRHRLATLLHRDLASTIRSRVDLPMLHLVER
ncbi:hypothetical protein [Kribbella speibonae]|uniref:Universal stress protein n=1 Tax=Kribbella speibonae TaxID=1572660 RepID=A0ABY2AB04_9ACTN|nr:hypothetical protein [Kribbella speibonae]TCC26883.1 hypothetical protein E0H58_02415 [Kribbella speibonae]